MVKLVWLVLISVMLTACASNNYYGAQHEENVARHILRVSGHGYLINSDNQSDSLVFNDEQLKSHMTLSEVNERFKHIFSSALQLACRNEYILEGEMGESKLSHCTHTSDQAIQTLDECAQMGLTLKACNQTVYESFKSMFIDRKVPIKFLVYFHGGLNNYDNSDERLSKQLEYIKSGLPLGHPTSNYPNPGFKTVTNDWQYPIFVSWPSSALSTYEEHLLSIREGRRVNPNLSFASTPVILFEDIVTSIGEFPANMYYQFTNDKDRMASNPSVLLSHVWKEANLQFNNLQCKPNGKTDASDFEAKKVRLNAKSDTEDKESFLYINRSVYKRSSLKHRGKVGVFILLTPIRYVVGGIWNGTFAGNAWQVMKRRARNMFDPTGDADARLQKELEFQQDYRDGVGSSLGAFFESLLALQSQFPEADIRLTLVGHSMGTIAINNLLQRYQSEWQKSDILRDVIYMAAAASTQETLSIVPEIMKNSPQTNFYNLTLNRVSEVAEDYLWGAGPSGSLLVSIDKYHDQPEHHLKRTFGSEVNVRSSLPAILNAFEGVNGNVTLKAFNNIEFLPNGIEPILPVKHGDFGDLNYWLPTTWEITNENNQLVKKKDIVACTPKVVRPLPIETTKEGNEKSEGYVEPVVSDVLFKTNSVN